MYSFNRNRTDSDECNHGSSISQLLATLYSHGHLLFAAAGNITSADPTNVVAFPASDSNVVAVSGTTAADQFADPATYSCRTPHGTVQGGSVSGSKVEISAPIEAYSTYLSGGYAWDCGTSMSTPMAAGVAGLVWSEYPNWSNRDVRVRLDSDAVDLGPAGRDAQYGWGRVDARAAHPPYPAPTITISGPATVKPNSPCRWTATLTGGVAPFRFQWFQNGILVDSAQTTTRSFSASGSLTVQVSSYQGDTGTATKNIAVNNLTLACQT